MIFLKKDLYSEINIIRWNHFGFDQKSKIFDIARIACSDSDSYLLANMRKIKLFLVLLCKFSHEHIYRETDQIMGLNFTQVLMDENTAKHI